MQQEIINRHFERYDIPSVIELSSGISTLWQISWAMRPMPRLRRRLLH